MAGMSVDGLVSGLDTTSLISQLLQAEAAPQTQLKTKLSTVNAGAAAYRTVNTRFDAIRTAAAALTATGLAAARTVKSDNTSVTASATTAATNGTNLSFAVTQLATTQVVSSERTWTSATDATAGSVSDWSIELEVGGTTHTFGGSGTLADTAAAINAKGIGVQATVLRTDTNEYRLQISSKTTGTAGEFKASSSDTTVGASAFRETSTARDAELDLGNGVSAYSSSNTFTDLVTGVNVTVTKADPATTVTVRVGEDVEGTAAKVKTLVDAVNSALDSINTYSNSKGGSTAVLKGDSELRSLTSRLLRAVSDAVDHDGDLNTIGRSPAAVGLELTREGKVTFNAATFTAALAKDPALAEQLVSGAEGIGQRLLGVAERASDSATGSLTLLANGRDTLAKDIQKRIDAWDTRLVLRKQTLTRQFTAMETALSSLKNQSTWLAGQLNSLPGSS